MKVRGKKTFTCPNPSCGKTFDKPLKTLNLQQDSAEPYPACPYCLTRITWAEAALYEKANQNQKEAIDEEKPDWNKEKPSICRHYLGYLSEREQKEQIPEECIVCQNIIDCMLRKMRS